MNVFKSNMLAVICFIRMKISVYFIKFIRIYFISVIENLTYKSIFEGIELEATRAMLEDASKSIGFFSMPQSDEFKKYIDNSYEDVDKIVKRVMEIVKNNK